MSEKEFSDEMNANEEGKAPEGFVHKFNSGIIRKSEYFDLFISYKRDNGDDHGQELAIELHRKLTADGYKVWLDNEEIGFSSNFEQRIEEALLHSKKLACIIGPGWVESPNCRYEVKKAVEFEKRIIPIHYQEFRGLLKSKMDAGDLTLDEWNRIDKPQEIDFSSKAKYQKGYQDLKAVCDLHDEITAKHNRLLCDSYYWKKYGSPKSMLPVGTYLSKTKLIRSKCNSDNDLPTFTPLQNEFIEAGENFVKTEVSRNRQAYIAWSKDEYPYAQELNMELKLHGIFTWFDELESLDKEENKFIEPIMSSDNLIEIVGETHSDEDDVKAAYARSNNKRIIQVTESREVLNAHRENGVKNIFLWNGQVRIDELITTINGDSDYNAAHSRLLQQAFEWEKSGKSNSKLLPYKEANAAKEWLDAADQSGAEPQPNVNMFNFGERSVAYAETLRKRRIGLLWTAILGSILIIVLGWSAWSLGQQAKLEQQKVERAKVKADKALRDANSAKKKALIAQADAQKALDDVDAAKEELKEANKELTEAQDKVSKAEADVLAAQVDLANAQGDLNDAMADLTDAQIDLTEAQDELSEAKDEVDKAKEDLAITQKEADAAKLSLEAFDLTLDGKYDDAEVKADSSVALYNEIDNADYETDILYNTYYAILSKEKEVDQSNIEFIEERTVGVSSIKLDHCTYAIDDEFDWELAEKIVPDSSLIYSMTLSTTAPVGAIGLKSGKVIIFNTSENKVLDEVSVGTYRVTSIDINSTATQLVASTVNGQFTIVPLQKNTWTRDPEKQLIRRESFARIEEIEYIDDNTIRAIGGSINDNGQTTKTYQKYPATVKKLKEIIGE